MNIREWPFINLAWPHSALLISVALALSSGFLVAFFASSQVAVPLVLSSVLSFYFNLVFWSHIFSLLWESTKSRRQPLDKSSAPPTRPFYDDITLPRILLLMAFSIIQQVLLIAAINRGWPEQFIPVTLGSPGPWGDFLRATFAAFDTLATIGFGTLRPLELPSVYLVSLNIYQLYFLDAVLFGIVLTRTPRRVEWLVGLRTKGVLASTGGWGTWVLVARYALNALLFALGFIESRAMKWVLFGVFVPSVMHSWALIAVYIYNTALRHRGGYNVFYLVALYLDAVLTLATGVALFTSVVDGQILFLETGVAWLLRYGRTLPFIIDTLVGYGTFQYIPYGNWALALTSALTIQGFVLRIAVFADVFGRFFQVKR